MVMAHTTTVLAGFALLPNRARESSVPTAHAQRPSPCEMPPNNAHETTDAELLGRSARGDKQAFAQLYDRFSRPLFSMAWKIVGNQTEAEDLVQEVFVDLWAKAPEFDARRAQPFTWAVSIMRNKAIDRLRSRTRRGAIVERSAEDIAARALGAEPVDVRDSVSSSDSAGMIRAAFTALPDDQQAAIELAYFEGLTQTEIAERLSQPLGTIKARIRRGLLRLREQLAGTL